MTVLNIIISGLPFRPVRLPVPRPVCRGALLRDREGLGPLKVHVQVPPLDAAGVLLKVRL